jgi:D-glycero-alpha-D-manno-heptose-7-phosphate kinase
MGREPMLSGDWVHLEKRLEREPVAASAPCRVDMGGTLDISTFSHALGHLRPVTCNIALSLRTRVRLRPFRKGRVKVSSRGFPSAEFSADRAPFDHPLGLMFAVAARFRAAGVHVEVASESPPRSALGGSSVAAVALAAAFLSACGDRSRPATRRRKAALVAHGLEAGVAGVPCGIQDHLAAAFGGVNAWHWSADPSAPPFRRQVLVRPAGCRRLSRHLLVAYCGRPHVSRDVNARWVRQFLSGNGRRHWEAIARLSRRFADAVARWDLAGAAAAMNRETAIRREMTPDVLDAVGADLFQAAAKGRCGARFAGAGAGGCLWALGEREDMENLRDRWAAILARSTGAGILDVDIDTKGLLVNDWGHHPPSAKGKR